MLVRDVNSGRLVAVPDNRFAPARLGGHRIGYSVPQYPQDAGLGYYEAAPPQVVYDGLGIPLDCRSLRHSCQYSRQKAQHCCRCSRARPAPHFRHWPQNWRACFRDWQARPLPGCRPVPTPSPVRAIAAPAPGTAAARHGRNAPANRCSDAVRNVCGNAVGILCADAAGDACAKSRTRSDRPAIAAGADASADAGADAGIDANANATGSFAHDGTLAADATPTRRAGLRTARRSRDAHASSAGQRRAVIVPVRMRRRRRLRRRFIGIQPPVLQRPRHRARASRKAIPDKWRICHGWPGFNGWRGY